MMEGVRGQRHRKKERRVVRKKNVKKRKIGGFDEETETETETTTETKTTAGTMRKTFWLKTLPSSLTKLAVW